MVYKSRVLLSPKGEPSFMSRTFQFTSHRDVKGAMSDSSDVESPFCRRMKSDQLRNLQKNAFENSFSSYRFSNVLGSGNLTEDEFYSADESRDVENLSKTFLSSDKENSGALASRSQLSEVSQISCSEELFEGQTSSVKSLNLQEDRKILRALNQKLNLEDSSADRRKGNASRRVSSSGSSDSEADLKYLALLRHQTKAKASSTENDEEELNRGQTRKRRTDSFIVSDEDIESATDADDESEDDEEVQGKESDASEISNGSDAGDNEIRHPIAGSNIKKSTDNVLASLKTCFSSPSIQRAAIDDSEHFLISLNKTHKYVRHRDAEKYIDAKRFKKNREELAQMVFKHVNGSCFKNKLPEDLSITWNSRLRKTAGYCRLKKNRGSDFVSIIRKVEVELSAKVLTEPERLRDTLIHELCHAAVFLLDAVDKDHHGPCWSKWANICMKRHPKLPFISRCHNYDITTKFLYVCDGCGQKVKRHTDSVDTSKQICGICKGRFMVQVLTKDGYKRRSLAKTQSPKGNLFAKFVKLHYSTIKKPGITHKEVMQSLSAKWKAERQNGNRREEPNVAVEKDSPRVPVLEISDSE